jgi:hypothetical protein
MELSFDILISTLDQIVRALGARVRLLPELPGWKPLLLAGPADLAKSARRRVSPGQQIRDALTERHGVV